MAQTLQHWRRRNNLTQVDAAAMLGVSQPYLSLLEKGARPLTPELRTRLKLVRREAPSGESVDDRIQRQLTALGYPGFAHLPSAKRVADPSSVILDALSQKDLNARVATGLFWLVRQYLDELDLPWLVRQAKLLNLQNRMGFLFQLATGEEGGSEEFRGAVAELDQARLLTETTFCWDSMRPMTREWMRENRTPLAEHWNILPRLRDEDVHQHDRD